MIIFAIVPFVIIFLMFWLNKPKRKTQEELEEERFNKGLTGIGVRRGESYKEYKNRKAKEESENVIQLKRSEVLSKKFYEFKDLLLELDDFYVIQKNTSTILNEENDFGSYANYMAKIEKYKNEFLKNGYINSEIKIESYLQRCYIPYNSKGTVGFQITTIISTIHSPESIKLIFSSFYTWKVSSYNDSFAGESFYQFISNEYSKSKNEEGLKLKEKLSKFLELKEKEFENYSV